MYKLILIFFSGEDQFYPNANTLIQGSHYPTQCSLEKLSSDVQKQLVFILIK